jgi:hypothetical protein
MIFFYARTYYQPGQYPRFRIMMMPSERIILSDLKSPENKKGPEINPVLNSLAVVSTGIEPVTHGFSVRCSTN